MELSINFSTNLRMLRKRKNMTQSDLAKNLNYSEKAISKWERGGSIPPIDTLFDIARILETTVDALFSSQDRYYLAIDGGGSKTALLLADQDGRTIRTHRVTACNPIDIGIDKACAILSDAISTICEGIPKSNIVAFAGIAGGTSADMREKLHSFLAEQGFAAFDNDSDSKNIIAAGLGARDGIAMIMGTGICAFKYQGGEVSRVAGWGYLIDDGGSGYNIGRDALAAYFSAIDGSGAPTLISREIDRMYPGGASEIMKYIYSESKRAVASFAPAVYSALEDGDTVARDILNKNMRYAAHIAETARSGFKGSGRVPLVIAGGLTKREETVAAFRAALTAPEIFEISVLDREPIYGALKMAMMIEKQV